MEYVDLDHRFAYHPPTNDPVKASHGDDIRASCLQAATDINRLVPEGREKSLAVTKLEEAMMWANAGIARGSGGVQGAA